jgi:hypothetical protein
MQLKTFVLPIKNLQAAEAEMNAFLRSHRVLAVKSPVRGEMFVEPQAHGIVESRRDDMFIARAHNERPSPVRGGMFIGIPAHGIVESRRDDMLIDRVCGEWRSPIGTAWPLPNVLPFATMPPLRGWPCIWGVNSINIPSLRDCPPPRRRKTKRMIFRGVVCYKQATPTGFALALRK